MSSAIAPSVHPQVQAVDLFCGAGGLTCGLRKAGIDVKAGVDVEKRCEFVYSYNNQAKFIAKSVTDVSGEELTGYTAGGDYTLLAGCAPCQAFSSYNPKAQPTDPRWKLLLQFSRLVGEVRPDLVTMENVPQLATKDVFEEFVENLTGLGYYIDWKVVACERYGLPQRRHRLVLLASRLGPIKIMSAEEFGASPRSVRDAIGGLPAIDAGGICPTDPLHRSASLSKLNLARIRASKPGGNWCDWPKSLRAPCHLKPSGSSYKSVYGRMTWDAPSPTMTTQFIGFGSGRFGHPEQNRAISLREGALLQSFPPDYQFTKPGDPIELRAVARMIGNAVPVVIGELIGKSIFKHLAEVKNSAVRF